ncbi:hypothetical protein BV898_08559 [Hypsibius exemplaris]|uniref:Uncharacterized protein n=1 Tax=Hypsibius exemplaris TaxID=2072580 RepID=A0A1W0WQ45_HYPEX|nr:hypothetical protein BV898_08559 [Hypsibius exemplaris]
MWSECPVSPQENPVDCLVELPPPSSLSTTTTMTRKTTRSDDPEEIIVQCLQEVSQAFNGTGLQTFVISDIEGIIGRLHASPPVKLQVFTPPSLLEQKSFLLRFIRATQHRLSVLFATTVARFREPIAKARMSFFQTLAFCTKRNFDYHVYEESSGGDCETLLDGKTEPLRSVEFYQSAVKVIRKDLDVLKQRMMYNPNEVTLTGAQSSGIELAFRTADRTLQELQEGKVLSRVSFSADPARVSVDLRSGSARAAVRSGPTQGRNWKVTLNEGADGSKREVVPPLLTFTEEMPSCKPTLFSTSKNQQHQDLGSRTLERQVQPIPLRPILPSRSFSQKTFFAKVERFEWVQNLSQRFSFPSKGSLFGVGDGDGDMPLGSAKTNIVTLKNRI